MDNKKEMRRSDTKKVLLETLTVLSYGRAVMSMAFLLNLPPRSSPRRSNDVPEYFLKTHPPAMATIFLISLGAGLVTTFLDRRSRRNNKTETQNTQPGH